MSSGERIVTGSYVGTGAAYDVDKVGWHPKYVRIFNFSDPSLSEHFEGMAEATAIMQKAGSTSKIATEGVTLTTDGFRVGTNADLNTAGETYFYLAVGS